MLSSITLPECVICFLPWRDSYDAGMIRMIIFEHFKGFHLKEDGIKTREWKLWEIAFIHSFIHSSNLIKPLRCTKHFVKDEVVL